MTRVVVDTNVLISALIFGGLPGKLLDLAFRRGFQLISSPVLLDELDEKLLGKFELSRDDVVRIRAKIESNALIVHPTETLHVIIDDPDDDRVLECAVAGRADCIVSGDKHLLGLRSYAGISIMNSRLFMESGDYTL